MHVNLKGRLERGPHLRLVLLFGIELTIQVSYSLRSTLYQIYVLSVSRDGFHALNTDDKDHASQDVMNMMMIDEQTNDERSRALVVIHAPGRCLHIT